MNFYISENFFYVSCKVWWFPNIFQPVEFRQTNYFRIAIWKRLQDLFEELKTGQPRNELQIRGS